MNPPKLKTFSSYISSSPLSLSSELTSLLTPRSSSSSRHSSSRHSSHRPSSSSSHSSHRPSSSSSHSSHSDYLSPAFSRRAPPVYPNLSRHSPKISLKTSTMKYYRPAVSTTQHPSAYRTAVLNKILMSPHALVRKPKEYPITVPSKRFPRVPRNYTPPVKLNSSMYPIPTEHSTAYRSSRPVTVQIRPCNSPQLPAAVRREINRQGIHRCINVSEHSSGIYEIHLVGESDIIVNLPTVYGGKLRRNTRKRR